MRNFHETSKREKCPVCGHAGWCIVSNDGGTCICRRVPSGRPANGGGWIHVLKREIRTLARVAHPIRPKARAFDAARAQAGFRAEMAIRDGAFDYCCEDLWLEPDAVRRMEVGYSGFHEAWTFPMRDGMGNVIGIRLREIGGSRKWAVPGSLDGLFYDPRLAPAVIVENGLKGREIVVCEGPTDCMAGYEIGLPCVGRASCATGLEHLKALCARLRVDRVTIVADNDAAKSGFVVRATCGAPMRRAWRPGIDGAERLGRELGRMYRIVLPPTKDLRDWVYAGENGITGEGFRKNAALQGWKCAHKDI